MVTYFLLVVMTWGLLLGLYLGVGLLFRAAIRCPVKTVRDLWLTPWLGWAAGIGVLQIWHLWWPVDGWALGLMGGLSVAGFVLGRSAVARALHGTGRGSGSDDGEDVLPRRWIVGLLVAGVVGLALWVARHSVMQPGIYDSGLYHLNAVRWNAEYAIVPGLGILHGRLAFNNSSFLYAAMLDIGPFAHRSHHLASGFLIWLFMLEILRSAWRELFGRGLRQMRDLFMVFFAGPVVVWTVNSGYASSPSPDVPCFLLAILVSAELIRMLETAEHRSRRDALMEIGLLAMVGITVKLSFAVFGAAAGLLAYAVHVTALFRGRGGAGDPVAVGGDRRSDVMRRATVSLLLLVLLGALTLGVWSVRGIVLSGYPAYPARIGGVPVEWAVTPSSMEVMVERIRNWARVPGSAVGGVPDDWQWLGPWFRRTLRDNAFDFTAPLVALLAGGGLWLARGVRGAGRRSGRGVWAAFLPALAGDAVWFFSAPDPRYQGALLWVLGLGVFTLGVADWRRRWLVALVTSVGVLVYFVHPIDMIRTWNDPGPARRVAMRIHTTTSGLNVQVPETGDQSWDSDLPSTPYFMPGLRLRVAGDMAGGFTRGSVRPPQ